MHDLNQNSMHINCHTFFSLNYGIMTVEELLEQARASGNLSFALTDINNTSGVLDTLRLAPQYGVKPVIGVDFRNERQQMFIALAKNNLGFREINEYLTVIRQTKQEVPPKAPHFENIFVIYPWRKGVVYNLDENEYVGLKAKDITKYRLYGTVPKERLVIHSPVTFRHRQDFNAHKLLRCISYNIKGSQLEPDMHGTESDKFMRQEDIQERFAEFDRIVENTRKILAECNVSFEFGKTKNKLTFSETHQEDVRQLTRLAEEGLAYRYKSLSPKIRSRFQSELKTIIDLGFTAYFLINWDIVRFAQEKGFYYIGRGSGANSIIAYCLRITDVDPIELDLYFERFINPSRSSPPDFDIDFSHTDRDIIRDYIFEKYKGHVALVGSYSTFEMKSAIREIGKVYGLTPREIETIQASDGKKLDEYGRAVWKYANHIYGFPNLLSVHACGILISELPITTFSALELMPVGYPSTQFSMLEAEDVGLYKYDILSQRGLAHIKDAVGLVRERTGKDIDIHAVQSFKEDPKMNALLRRGDTIGCFYIESPAMRQLLRKLEVEDYLGLVAASSIIRPGVSSSGMMREYILRYRDPEKRKDAHPRLLEIMPDTFGVMVYQEDVLKVAHYYAGLTLEEADVMRRGMSGKFRSREEFQKVKATFFSNCAGKGYPSGEAAEIWRQIESFAGYSFAKGHSASFAVESYQSLYLRTYYPLEFITGVLNNFGGFYSTEFYLHEAKMLSAHIELPCVNESEHLMRLKDKTLYMGFCLVKDLEQATIANILSARRSGAFTCLEDFLKRVSISLEQLRILIRIKAFKFTGLASKELLWDAHLRLGKSKKTVPRREIFPSEPEPTDLPELDYTEYEDPLDEVKILGFPYTSPFNLLKKCYKGIVYANELINKVGEVVYMIGYYVTLKPVHTVLDETMYFCSFIDGRGELFDTVHFPKSIERYPFTGKGCYLIKGTVVEDFGVPSIDVQNMERIAWAFAWEE